MPVINCEVNLVLKWSSTCLTNNSTGAGRFTTTDTKLYVPVVTLSTEDNAKLLEQLKAGFKEQSTGVNINQRYQQKLRINI